LPIEDEIARFEVESALLGTFIIELAKVDPVDVTNEHHFMAEAVVFRLYRIYERLTRAAFLNYCVDSKTPSGADVRSKLRCNDWDTAEAILKSGNKFLDWGNVESTRRMANLVFMDGFPISDIVSPIASTLTDLQRFRNFVAHDSEEAATGFKRSRTQYVRVGDPPPETVGELSIYKKAIRAEITLSIVHTKVSGLGTIIKSL
jgi:hypothetical protein